MSGSGRRIERNNTTATARPARHANPRDLHERPIVRRGPRRDLSTAENLPHSLGHLISAIAILGGSVLLWELLNQAGERFHETLGIAAILRAMPHCLHWAILLVGHYHARLRSTGEVAPWILFLALSHARSSDILLRFGGLFTSLATAAYTASLGRTQWLGKKATRACVTASLFGFLCLASRGLDFPDPEIVFQHWYTIPGFIFGIPAIPWLLPCILGIVMLRRTSRPSN